MEAVKEVIPYAENRQCARHIVANFSKKFPGAHFENLFWKACNATTEAEFKIHMKELEILCPLGHQYLMDKDPKTWSRAYYETGRCCDAVENGCSESFNAVIVDARKKPIISMLEDLRMYMMNKLFIYKSKKWSKETAPAIRKQLTELKIQQRNWHVLPSGFNKFEARCGNESFEVDLDKRTCACRLWQLNGYGCVHSVAAICSVNRDVDDYVDKMFKRELYDKTYQYSINPINGSKMWPETTYLPPLPPVKRRMPGRPKTKRIRAASERVGKHKLSKAGRKVCCGICHKEGHNRKTCPTPTVTTAQKLPVKRPRGNNGAGTSQQGGQKKRAKRGTVGGTVDAPTRSSVNVNGDNGAMGGTVDAPTRSSVNVHGDNEAMGGSVDAPRVRKKVVPQRVKRSERIAKKKLAKKVHGKNGLGDSANKPVDIE